MSAQGKCSVWHRCSAPLCPLDEGSLRDAAWSPGEPICSSKEHGGAGWIARQRKIAKATGGDPDRGCLTHAMLEHRAVIGRAFKGLDPGDGELTPERVGRWIAQHPARPPARPLTEERVAKRRAVLSAARGSRARVFHAAGANEHSPKSGPAAGWSNHTAGAPGIAPRPLARAS